MDPFFEFGSRLDSLKFFVDSIQYKHKYTNRYNLYSIDYTLLYRIKAMVFFVRYYLKKAFKSSSGSFSTGTIRKFPIVFDFSQACMGADNGVSLIKCGQTLPVEAWNLTDWSLWRRTCELNSAKLSEYDLISESFQNWNISIVISQYFLF